MSSYHGWTHAPKAQGGTDPIPSIESIEGVILYAWNYDSDNTVPTQTWTPLGAYAGGGGYFEESFEFPLNSTFSWDHETGTVGNSTEGLFVAHAFVQFWDDANVGETRAVAFNHGSSLRYVNSHYIPTATGVGDHRLIVSETWLAGFNPISVSLECWHDHGSDITIRDAQIAVYRMGRDLTADQYQTYVPS